MSSVATKSIKIISLCQVNDIIPMVFQANRLKLTDAPEKLIVLDETADTSLEMPSIEEMQKCIQKKGPQKKGYEIDGVKSYLLLSSLHNRGMGCGGTSPMVPPLLVFLVDENGNNSGGVFQNLTKTYDKFRELVDGFFDKERHQDPLIVITPHLNKKILKRQLLCSRTALSLAIEEMTGSYDECGDE